MGKMNNKGFTLVELIAVVVLLSIVMGIGAYSITAVIESSRKKDYQILIQNINNAVEGYYLECLDPPKDADGEDIIDCPFLTSGYYVSYNFDSNGDGIDDQVKELTLGDLVTTGHLDGNSTDSDDKFTLTNPNDGNNISNCKIKYKYSNGNIVVEAVEPTGSCPTNY